LGEGEDLADEVEVGSFDDPVVVGEEVESRKKGDV